MPTTELRVKSVMAGALEIPIECIDRDSSPDTIPQWDSLRHLNLVLGLEAEFNITFTEDEMVEILSYPLILEILKNHGVTVAPMTGK